MGGRDGNGDLVLISTAAVHHFLLPSVAGHGRGVLGMVTAIVARHLLALFLSPAAVSMRIAGSSLAGGVSHIGRLRPCAALVKC